VSWKHHLKNDFELPVFSAWPEIASIKNTLDDHGAIYAAMSGSGSTVYGIFEETARVDTSIFPDNYFVKELSLKQFSNVI
jgi:4-diphosphocytidyl-2-C-methyl-D-erythritol kinase